MTWDPREEMLLLLSQLQQEAMRNVAARTREHVGEISDLIEEHERSHGSQVHDKQPTSDTRARDQPSGEDSREELGVAA